MAARCCTEPLITIDNDGKVFPVLAAEVPSAQNGGLSPDGKSVTYKLKPGIKWADGQPFSADDVAFTFQFIADPASSARDGGQLRQHREGRGGRSRHRQDHLQGADRRLVRAVLGLQRPDPAEAHR